MSTHHFSKSLKPEEDKQKSWFNSSEVSRDKTCLDKSIVKKDANSNNFIIIFYYTIQPFWANYTNSLYQLKTLTMCFRNSVIFWFKPFRRQSYRSERDAEKRLGTNTTGKYLRPPQVVCCDLSPKTLATSSLFFPLTLNPLSLKVF